MDSSISDMLLQHENTIFLEINQIQKIPLLSEYILYDLNYLHLLRLALGTRIWAILCFMFT